MLPMFLLLVIPFCICSAVVAAEDNCEQWHLMRGMEQICTVVIKTDSLSLYPVSTLNNTSHCKPNEMHTGLHWGR